MITKEFIKETLERKTGLDLKRRTRIREYINVRAVYYELCREYTMESLASIGKLLDKDHATVIHGRKVFSNLHIYEPSVYELYVQFKDEYPVDLYKGYKREVIVEKADEELTRKCIELYDKLQETQRQLEIANVKYENLCKQKLSRFDLAVEELTEQQKDMAYERFIAMVSMVKSARVY